MSRNRVKPDAGWATPSKLEKGTNGRNLCRYCKVEVGKGRRTFCSDECVHEWKIRTQPGYVRDLVSHRDKGICAHCRLDTHKLARIFRKLHKKMSLWSYNKKPEEMKTQRENSRRRLEGLIAAFPWAKFSLYSGYHRSLWQADHIVPVVEGGGECGLENYRTLCTPCHKKVTKELHQRLKEKRREASGK